MPDNNAVEIRAQLPEKAGEPHYLVCWTEDDGIYSCGHEHQSIADAMRCLIPDGRSFIRASESGALRSLDEGELITFLDALRKMPWRRGPMERREERREQAAVFPRAFR